jgi:hypothetical protein
MKYCPHWWERKSFLLNHSLRIVNYEKISLNSLLWRTLSLKEISENKSRDEDISLSNYLDEKARLIEKIHLKTSNNSIIPNLFERSNLILIEIEQFIHMDSKIKWGWHFFHWIKSVLLWKIDWIDFILFLMECQRKYLEREMNDMRINELKIRNSVQ